MKSSLKQILDIIEKDIKSIGKYKKSLLDKKTRRMLFKWALKLVRIGKR